MALVSALREDPGSHLYAALAGWAFPMPRPDLNAALLAQRVVNFLRDQSEKPWAADWPWDSDLGRGQADVTDEERERLRARLRSVSAIPD
ncbi:hypothetical protein [Sinomonas sp. ASV322]|uniref:hypothetical protein n=1 Tax=Sinomonas sp. ASV322 TaxID=3041920 RepID=UPI0027DB5C2B|nr:hypothetical protein [Sinomonas sp. ASV322]MDQ4502185.1 hypothetical protein [Sinomonas sp. ASV322]